MIVPMIVFGLIAGGLAFVAIRWFFADDATPLDHGSAWFGDFRASTEPEPYDWAKEMAALGRRRPDSLPPVHIEARRAA